MAGIEELINTDIYLAVIGISLFFTVFAIVRRTAVLDAIATMCWWITGATSIVASPSTSPLFAISYLWFGLGTLFLILLFADIWKYFDIKKSRDTWMEDDKGW